MQYRQRPLDTLAIDTLSVAAADSARRLALAKRWDEGRATLRKAAAQGGTPAAILALKAAHAALETTAEAPEAWFLQPTRRPGG